MASSPTTSMARLYSYKVLEKKEEEEEEKEEEEGEPWDHSNYLSQCHQAPMFSV